MAIGALFGFANIATLAGLVHSIVRTDGTQTRRAATLAAVKFPLLYAALFLVLKFGHVGPIGFLAGFTAMLAALLVTAAVNGTSNNRTQTGTQGDDARAR